MCHRRACRCVLAGSSPGADGSGACEAAARGRGGEPPPAPERDWEREGLAALSGREGLAALEEREGAAQWAEGEGEK